MHRRVAIGAAAGATVALSAPASACEACRPAVEALIFDPYFWTNVAFSALPFAVIAVVVVAVERLMLPSSREGGSP